MARALLTGPQGTQVHSAWFPTAAVGTGAVTGARCTGLGMPGLETT